MINFKYDQDKAIAAILYICHKLKKQSIDTDLHKVFKILYFAERKLLAKYGMPITGDFFSAMPDGPVPSKIYDLLKMVRNKSPILEMNQVREYFRIENWKYIVPLRSPDMDELSEADLKVINESIEENKHHSFEELKEKSHGDAYHKAPKTGLKKIDYCDMAVEEGAPPGICDLIKITSENQRFSTSL